MCSLRWPTLVHHSRACSLRRLKSYYAVSILYFAQSITKCCSQSNGTLLRMCRNTRRCQSKLYACTSEDRVKAPRVTLLATYDLSTGSPRNQIYEKKRNPRKSARKAKNHRAGAKPGFQLLPTYRRSSAPCIPRKLAQQKGDAPNRS